jgi:hypothetical protein
MKWKKILGIAMVMGGLWAPSPEAGALLAPDGTPREELLEIGKILRVDWGEDAYSISDFMQKHFLRPRTRERHTIEPSPYESYFESIIPLARRLGMVDPIVPPAGTYDYLLLMGQSVPMMRSQLEFARRLERNGHVRFKKIISLTGQRPLCVGLDDSDPLFLTCKEESEASQRLVENYFSDRLNSCLFVDSPMHRDGSRPTTRDTVVRWLQSNPPIGSILMLSNNPFILYQFEVLCGELVAAEWFSRGGTVTPCGNSVTLDYVGDNRIAVLLDNFARTLYTELRYRDEQ